MYDPGFVFCEEEYVTLISLLFIARKRALNETRVHGNLYGLTFRGMHTLLEHAREHPDKLFPASYHNAFVADVVSLTQRSTLSV